MKTIRATNSTAVYNSAQAKSKSLTLPGIFGTTWEKLQFNYYSVIVVTLIVGSCVGAAAAAYILQAHAPVWQLATCASLSMFNNTTAIGNMPIKWVAWSFIVALAGNILLIAVNL